MPYVAQASIMSEFARLARMMPSNAGLTWQGQGPHLCEGVLKQLGYAALVLAQKPKHL